MKLSDEELRRVACSMDAQDTVELLRLACELHFQCAYLEWVMEFGHPFHPEESKQAMLAEFQNFVRLFLPDDWKEST